MAVRVHIVCPCCGAPRTPDVFGLALADDDVTVLDEHPRYKPAIMVQTIGGRGRCSWERKPVPRAVVAALRDRLLAAAAYLDRILNDEDEDEDVAA